MSGIIWMGPSEESTRHIKVGPEFTSSRFLVNHHNWINAEVYPDLFDITIEGGTCTCTRLDQKTGWGISLLFFAPLQSISSSPYFFVESFRDQRQRRELHIQAHIKAINSGCTHYLIHETDEIYDFLFDGTYDMILWGPRMNVYACSRSAGIRLVRHWIRTHDPVESCPNLKILMKSIQTLHVDEEKC